MKCCDSVIHIYSFFIFSSIMIYHRILFPVLYCRTLCFIHPIYNSLCLLIPNSSLPLSPNPLSLGNHKSILHVCESVSVLQIGSLVPYLRYHIYLVSYGICLYCKCMILNLINLFQTHKILKLWKFWGFLFIFVGYDYICAVKIFFKMT